MGFYTHLLNHKAVVKSLKGTDSNNNPIFTTKKEIKCRIDFKASMTIGPKGQEIACTGRFYTESGIKTGDKIEFEGKDYTIVNVNPYYEIDASNIVVEAHFQ